MDYLDIIGKLSIEAASKMVLLVLDGLGGLPITPGGKTELETAHTPNLDLLSRKAICGMTQPIYQGITPGSGPAHLGLFGYDPIKYQVGRGVLAALGIDFPLRASDVAARINFATKNEAGLITDRRAGRIATEINQQLCARLATITIPGVELVVKTVKEHRAVVVFRGINLAGELNDSDPQQVGVAPKAVVASTPAGEEAATVINRFIAEANRLLADEPAANMVLLRGISPYQPFPPLTEICKFKAAAIANYPMYRGVAKLVGMEPIPGGDSLGDIFEALAKNFAEYDFFFLHVKKTDSYGEDGNFTQKVQVIEAVDKEIPRLLQLKPDVIAVTGDHSTPARLKAHSWHAVPLLLYSEYCRPDNVTQFSEEQCTNFGGLGNIYATELLPLMLANALRLNKFGA